MSKKFYTATTGGTEGTYSENYTYNSSTGNLASKGGVSYTYADSDHKHAVTSLSSGWTYQYDQNGNMTERNVDSSTYSLTYDAYNHLISVSGAASVDFVYDGDGQRVKVDDVVFIGDYYIYSAVGATNFYFVDGKRIAYGSSSLPKGNTYYYLSDHLNSSTVLVTGDRSYSSREGYKAWGKTRFGSVGAYKFTGQYYHGSLGLYYYGARYYDPVLGRFTQADTLVPEGVQGSQAWDRYAYVNNNPLRYTDPSGNMLDPEGDDFGYPDLFTDQVDHNVNFDDTLGDNIHNNQSLYGEKHSVYLTNQEPQNPSPVVLITIGILLHGNTILVESLILYAELSILPTIGVAPAISIPLELVLAGAGFAILYFDFAYDVYVYRVITNPEVHHSFELFPPWGLDY